MTFTKLVPSQTPSRTSHQSGSVKKMFLKIYKILRENTGVGFYKLYQKDAPTQVLPSEICEFFRHTYFEEYLRTPASVFSRIYKV